MPQILCPADVAITGAIGTGQLVTFTAPVQIAGSTPTVITCTPPSGSTFPIGSTLVRCTALDAFNQVGSCSFNVSISPLTLSALKFVAFGDSVTEGENSLPGANGLGVLFVDPANSYPTKLKNKLTVDFPTQNTTVVNAGLGGEFVKDGLKRLPMVLSANTPQALLLLDGYNDLLTFGAPSVNDVVDALEDMVRLAKASGVQYVFLSTLTPGKTPTTLPARQIQPALILQTNTLIRSTALAEGAFLVDSYNAVVGQEATLVSNDGLHLTPAGNEALATTFLAAIKTAAAKAGGPLSVLR